MKRRSRSWLASRAANASSSRSSIRFSASPSRPTSVRGSVGLDAVREVAAGDRGGGVAHAVQREQADAHDDQREAADEASTHDDHDALDEQQPLERLVGGRQRDRGDDRAAARRPRASTR